MSSAAAELVSRIDVQWWTSDEGRTHERLVPTAERIRRRQDYRKDADEQHARLYGNVDLLGLSNRAYAVARPDRRNAVGLNVIRNMCNTAVSKITKTKPRPMFLTSGGDYGMARKAQQLTKLTEGLFYETDLYEIGPAIFLDACVFGTGFLYVYARGQSIRVDRVFPWEIVVDDGEAQYGKPRSIYRKVYMDRAVLAALYPDQADAINTATPAREEDDPGRDTTCDQVLVWMAWHLPSAKGAADGKHAVAIEGATLHEEAWVDDYFPFPALRWNRPLMGFYGEGLAYELRNIQIEINKLLLEIQRGHHLIRGHYLVENGSSINTAALNNDIASIVRFTGMPPTFQVSQIIAPEVYQHLWALYQRAYEISGISQMSAQSSKPAGLNSGAALRTYDDIQTERFIDVGRTWENWFLEIARQMIALCRKMRSGMKVKARSKNMLEVIDFKDVNLKDDEYVMKVYPTSAFATTPAARMQQVQELAQAGWISPTDAKRLLDWPDLEEFESFQDASYDLVHKRIEAMLAEEPKYESPEPLDDIKTHAQWAQMAYGRAKLENVPEANLQLLRNYIADCKALIDAAMAPPPPPPAGPPGPGGGGGMALGAPPRMPDEGVPMPVAA